MTIFIPFLIGVGVAALLYITVGWWGFLAIFPWIGFSISFGIFIRRKLPSARKNIGRRISLLMILPMLLFFVPIVNHENFQLEGVALLICAGFLGKGVIHLAVAKVFGPLVWGRGFCGWACWTAASPGMASDPKKGDDSAVFKIHSLRRAGLVPRPAPGPGLFPEFRRVAPLPVPEGDALDVHRERGILRDRDPPGLYHE